MIFEKMQETLKINRQISESKILEILRKNRLLFYIPSATKNKSLVQPNAD